MPGSVIRGFELGPSNLTTAGAALSDVSNFFTVLLERRRIEKLQEEKERRLREAAAFPQLLQLAARVEPGVRPEVETTGTETVPSREISGLLPSEASSGASPEALAPPMSIGAPKPIQLETRTRAPLPMRNRTLRVPEDLQSVLGPTFSLPERYESDIPGNTVVTKEMVDNIKDPIQRGYWSTQIGRVVSMKELPEKSKPLVIGRGAVAIDPDTGKELGSGGPERPIFLMDTRTNKPIRVTPEQEAKEPGRYVPLPSASQASKMGLEDRLEIAEGLLKYEVDPNSLGRWADRAQFVADARKLAKSRGMTYDQTQYPARNKLRQKYTSGAIADNVLALNTAVDHIDVLKKLGTALNNYDFPMINHLVNWVRTQLGHPEVTNANVAAAAVTSELASILKKAGATDQEIAVWRARYDPESMSPDQINGAVDTGLRIMRGRERGIQTGWHNGMGKGVEDFPTYGEEQEEILKGLGYQFSKKKKVQKIEPSRDLSLLQKDEDAIEEPEAEGDQNDEEADSEGATPAAQAIVERYGRKP